MRVSSATSIEHAKSIMSAYTYGGFYKSQYCAIKILIGCDQINDDCMDVLCIGMESKIRQT